MKFIFSFIIHIIIDHKRLSQVNNKTKLVAGSLTIYFRIVMALKKKQNKSNEAKTVTLVLVYH